MRSSHSLPAVRGVRSTEMNLPRRLTLLALVAALSACSSWHTANFQGTAVVPVQSAPDFTLTDQSAKTWTLSSQRGENVALFFGYTHCPDVCPATMATLARATDALGAKKDSVEIAFVTVDPQRDTPAVLAKYVKLFGNEKIVGLTGSPGQLAPVLRLYHVWAQRIPGNAKHGGYDMAHSSAVYLIDASGNLRVVHNWDDTQAAFTHDLKELAG